MSLINKMLRDIDRRAADGVAEPAAVVQAQRPVGEPAPRRSVFLAVAVIALAIALGAAVWAAWRLKPSKLMSELAFRQAAEAQKPKSPATAQPAARPAPPPAVSPAPETPSAPAPVVAQAQTPPVPSPVHASRPAPRPHSLPRAKPSPPAPDPATLASEEADRKFQQAVALLNAGRVSEAEGELSAALTSDPNQVQARQAYVALLLEQGRIDSARRVLNDALERDPAQPMFALALARIDAEQRDFSSSLAVMDRTGSAAGRPDFQALRGAVYQRMGRHAEAVQAYESAVASGSQPAQTWISLAISLEALGRRAEAAQAYRRGMAGGALPQEVRDYAEARLRAVD